MHSLTNVIKRKVQRIEATNLNSSLEVAPAICNSTVSDLVEHDIDPATSQLSTSTPKNTEICGYSHFTQTRRLHCPHVVIAKAGINFCDTCNNLKYEKTEEAKRARIIHRAEAAVQKALSMKVIEVSIDSMSKIPSEERERVRQMLLLDAKVEEVSGRYAGVSLHSTADFAQSVLLPQHSEQEGSMFFQVGLKVNL